MPSQNIIGLMRDRAQSKATRTDHTDVYLPTIRKPLSSKSADAVEATLGFNLPVTLRRIYTEIGDGGFGPGYGFLPMIEPISKNDDSVLNLYSLFREGDPKQPTWHWPKTVLPIVDFGCAIRACVECDSGQIIVDDPNIDTLTTQTFLDQQQSLDEWLADWCDGEDLWERIYE